MNETRSHDAGSGTTRRKVDIEFLYIDLTVCGRCIGTEAHLKEALSELSNTLSAAGVEVSLRKVLVESEEQAEALGFFSSPTIRINGRDIALEFRESRCASCETCGCNAGTVDCRVWVFQGREYTEAPKAMIVDAILREVYGGRLPEEPPIRPREVPENLRRFFTARAAGSAAGESPCCPTAEQATCCPPSEKAACCG